jgi:hypothetical protein
MFLRNMTPSQIQIGRGSCGISGPAQGSDNGRSVLWIIINDQD